MGHLTSRQEGVLTGHGHIVDVDFVHGEPIRVPQLEPVEVVREVHGRKQVLHAAQNLPVNGADGIVAQLAMPPALTDGDGVGEGADGALEGPSAGIHHQRHHQVFLGGGLL